MYLIGPNTVAAIRPLEKLEDIILRVKEPIECQ